MNVQADLDGVLELEQRGKPARCDRTRVTHHNQHADVLVFKTHVVARHLDCGWRQQVSQGAGAAREAALLARQRLRRPRVPALLKTQTEHSYSSTSSGCTARTASVV